MWGVCNVWGVCTKGVCMKSMHKRSMYEEYVQKEYAWGVCTKLNFVQTRSLRYQIWTPSFESHCQDVRPLEFGPAFCNIIQIWFSVEKGNSKSNVKVHIYSRDSITREILLQNITNTKLKIQIWNNTRESSTGRSNAYLSNAYLQSLGIVLEF